MSIDLNNTQPTSEFGTRPSALMVYSPEHVDWAEITPEQLLDYGLIGEVSTEGFKAQYSRFLDALQGEGVKLLHLPDLIDPEDLSAIEEKINLMFTRDPATTVPWAPELFIPSNMSLQTRRTEVAGVARALSNLGMQPALHLSSDKNEFAEGEDLYPTVLDGERTMLVGVGTRTTTETAQAIASQLLGEVFDQVLVLEHDPEILHLDTGFTPLSNETLFVAEGMFLRGMLLNAKNRSGIEIPDPLEYFRDHGHKIVTTTKENAIKNEAINMVPIGNDTFVGFPLDDETRRKLLDASGAKIIEVPGDQIAPAQGGAHCLTRPIYAQV